VCRFVDTAVSAGGCLWMCMVVGVCVCGCVCLWVWVFVGPSVSTGVCCGVYICGFRV